MSWSVLIIPGGREREEEVEGGRERERERGREGEKEREREREMTYNIYNGAYCMCKLYFYCSMQSIVHHTCKCTCTKFACMSLLQCVCVCVCALTVMGSVQSSSFERSQ